MPDDIERLVDEKWGENLVGAGYREGLIEAVKLLKRWLEVEPGNPLAWHVSIYSDTRRFLGEVDDERT